MRSFVLLALFGVAAAASAEKTGDCLVNSGEAVSDAVDATLFMWAAAKRCGKAGMVIKCEIDITSAVKATTSMIEVILKAVDKCGGLNTANKECGLEAGKLTKHVAGLAASAGDVAQKCTKNMPEPAAMGDIAAPVMCTIDLKNTLKQLFKAIKDIRASHEECESDDPRDCAASAMDIVSSLAGMGGWLSGAVGHCRRTDPKVKDGDTRTELCTQAANLLLHDTMEVAESGTQMSQKCETSASARLFEQKKVATPAAASSSTANFVMGAFLPVAAFVGFVGGRMYAKNRPQTREIMSDTE